NVYGLFVSIGNYSNYNNTNYTDYGINTETCGLRYTPEAIDITYNNTKCFHNNYKAIRKWDTFGLQLHPTRDLLDSRVANGWPVKNGEAPWAVSLQFFDSHHLSRPTFCSGVLITRLWVLTAAHCIVNNAGLSLWVTAGANRNSGKDTVRVLAEPVIHSGYNVSVKTLYDLALVRLQREMYAKPEGQQFMVNTVCLPDKQQVNTELEWATLYGFGRIDTRNTTTNWLHRGHILLAPYDTCNAIKNTTRLLCSLNIPSVNMSFPCKGDSGSGLVQYTNKYRTRAILVGTHVTGIHVQTDCAFVKVGNYSDYYRDLGINTETCGLRFIPTAIDITYNNTKCFHNNYTHLRVMDMYGPHLWRKKDVLGSRVMNGRRAHLGEAPWVVSIQINYMDFRHGPGSALTPIDIYYCTGALIAKQWILTAAHCFKTSTFRAEESSHFPNQYDPNGNFTERDDIALVRLREAINVPVVGHTIVINTVCLPVENVSNTEPEWVTIFGFGFVNNIQHKQLPEWLHRGEIQLLPDTKCQKYPGYVALLCSNTFTTYNQSISCDGDSGAGFFQYTDKYRTRAILVGIQASAPVGNYPCNPGTTYQYSTTFS
ncbi:unnamed protein product, partial [Medioppia subpectinata]